MKHLTLVVVFLCFNACCTINNKFYIQGTDVELSSLPNDCSSALIHQINTSWLKFGNRPCHLYNQFSQSFGVENGDKRDCFLGMHKSLVTKLLGKPDVLELNKLVYQLDNTCEKDMDIIPDAVYRKNLIFRYSDDEIIDEIQLIRAGKR